MKLGIVVVYLVKDEDEELLRVHLDQIERSTTVPYTIYAGVNRLQPGFRRMLEAHKKVKICQLPKTDLRISEEHAFYLEHLFGQAISDGVSHVAVLHVDSFPVRSGWAKELAEKLSDRCVFAAVRRDEARDLKPNLMCILFPRDYYLAQRPRLTLSAAEKGSDEYASYSRKFPHVNETGVGYGLQTYRKGLTWYPLVRSNRAQDHYLIGSIYGDLIFHLGAAARPDKLFNLDRLSLTGGDQPSFAARSLGFIASLLPEVIKSRVRQRLLKAKEAENLAIYEKVRSKLFADPQAYLRYLRYGSK